MVDLDFVTTLASLVVFGQLGGAVVDRNATRFQGSDSTIRLTPLVRNDNKGRACKIGPAILGKRRCSI